MRIYAFLRQNPSIYLFHMFSFHFSFRMPYFFVKTLFKSKLQLKLRVADEASGPYLLLIVSFLCHTEKLANNLSLLVVFTLSDSG